jgi:hypothetical protein
MNPGLPAELAAEGTVGVAVASAVAALCGAFGACTAHGGGVQVQHLTNYVVFTAVHMLLHTAILAAAYRWGCVAVVVVRGAGPCGAGLRTAAQLMGCGRGAVAGLTTGETTGVRS